MLNVVSLISRGAVQLLAVCIGRRVRHFQDAQAIYGIVMFHDSNPVANPGGGARGPGPPPLEMLKV